MHVRTSLCVGNVVIKALSTPIRPSTMYSSYRIHNLLFTAVLVTLASFALASFASVDGFQAQTEGRTAPPAFVLKHETAKYKKSSESAGQKASLPPLIQQIADERAEFQINLGRAMDTLRRDMPEILSRTPGKHNLDEE